VPLLSFITGGLSLVHPLSAIIYLIQWLLELIGRARSNPSAAVQYSTHAAVCAVAALWGVLESCYHAQRLILEKDLVLSEIPSRPCLISAVLIKFQLPTQSLASSDLDLPFCASPTVYQVGGKLPVSSSAVAISSEKWRNCYLGDGKMGEYPGMYRSLALSWSKARSHHLCWDKAAPRPCSMQFCNASKSTCWLRSVGVHNAQSLGFFACKH